MGRRIRGPDYFGTDLSDVEVVLKYSIAFLIMISGEQMSTS
jgi:hypothetical protein